MANTKHPLDATKEKKSIDKKIRTSTLESSFVRKKIPIRVCEYKISNTSSKMLSSESIAISDEGLIFETQKEFHPQTIMRIWVEMPDYWGFKSKLVEYKQTEAPQYFQILARVLNCEQNSKTTKNKILCEILFIDSIDQTILNNYLHEERVQKP